MLILQCLSRMLFSSLPSISLVFSCSIQLNWCKGKHSGKRGWCFSQGNYC
ncbi:unnamed protein product, partial [Cylicostephanus goldi]